MAQNYRHVVFLSIKEGNMLTQTKIFVWGAYNFKKCQKTGFQSVADVYLKSCKKQNKGNRDH